MKNAPEAEPQLVRDRPLHPAATANAERAQGRTSIGVKQAAAFFFDAGVIRITGLACVDLRNCLNTDDWQEHLLIGLRRAWISQD